jgi:hypothetical protein
LHPQRTTLKPDYFCPPTIQAKPGDTVLVGVQLEDGGGLACLLAKCRWRLGQATEINLDNFLPGVTAVGNPVANCRYRKSCHPPMSPPTATKASGAAAARSCWMQSIRQRGN